MASFGAPRKVAAGDSLDDFCCGIDFIDDWARAHAHDAEKRGTAIVYVAMAGEKVAGFYSLCTHSVSRDDVKGGWLRRNTPDAIPVILLGMLGVDESFKGQGLGWSLLGDAIERSLAVAAQIGAKALIVDPVDVSARAFYEKYGFKSIPGLERMFIPLR